jgi:type VI secretion system ImpM family protein
MKWRLPGLRRRTGQGAAQGGLFGKLPRQRDFVRVGRPWPLFERWLEGQLEALAARGEGLGDEGMRLFLPLEDGDAWAVLRPSQDAVGRRFPLALFVRPAIREARDAVGGLAASWRQRARFFLEAEALLVRAQDGQNEDLLQRLEALVGAPARAEGPAPVPAPGPQFSPTAQAVFVAACSAGRKTPPLTVEAPAADEATRAFWLGLLDAQGPGVWPTVVAGPARLVLGFAQRGAAPVLTAHGLGARAGARHWMVLPDVASAKES